MTRSATLLTALILAACSGGGGGSSPPADPPVTSTELARSDPAPGVVVSIVAVWEGFNAIPTAEGVGRATTRTVTIESTAAATITVGSEVAG